MAVWIPRFFCVFPFFRITFIEKWRRNDPTKASLVLVEPWISLNVHTASLGKQEIYQCKKQKIDVWTPNFCCVCCFFLIEGLSLLEKVHILKISSNLSLMYWQSNLAMDWSKGSSQWASYIKMQKEKNWQFEPPVFFVFFLPLGSPSSRIDIGMIYRTLVCLSVHELSLMSTFRKSKIIFRN